MLVPHSEGTPHSEVTMLCTLLPHPPAPSARVASLGTPVWSFQTSWTTNGPQTTHWRPLV